MESIKRSTTFKTIKRSATTYTQNIQSSKSFKTIKRSGTTAWKWVNAEDTNVSQSKPVGISFFQRNDTVRKLNQQTDGKLLRSKTLSRRPTTRPSIRRPTPANSLPLYSNSRKGDKYGQYVNLEDTDGLYGDNIKKPQTAAYQGGDDKKPKKGDIGHVPSVLYDPEVRKQLEAMHTHTPYFMYAVTAIQILTYIISLYLNFKTSGSPIAPVNTSHNIMIGPEAIHLIHMGARYSPCMKNMEEYSTNATWSCIPELKGSKGPNACSLSDYCGFGMEVGEYPNQWYRFILPIFLHSGLLHLFFNLTFQIRTGVDMEKDFGTWRIGIIYMATGIFGFIFGAYNSVIPSVGCSGALYGLIGCLFLDLIQSWKIIVNPWRELVKMLIIIAASFAIGLCSFIDNSAHVGGFISGILTGLIFLPTISFSKTDLRIKRSAMIVSIFVTIFVFQWVIKTFYSENQKCKWCKYINCIDYKDWCDAYK
ncbi:hypothetical protein BCR36DRAFT_108329 [Piromyces finnis]|uniref:Rhomboid-type serine protease n=1 Tax=Piromyces finnis TaxID=1754191 RepID=A0A1Y1V2D3_9FUNG|nr:hypothetical protein BCR36DRAFT_108329 [Piromyces finnis]|eukprot:ORX45773.1 hypothetical protein BCR36DRAFT_108329 [Piromyces finnis]